MILRFLGQFYSRFQQQIPTIPSNNIGCYRGQPYNIPVPKTISPPPSSKFQLTAVVLKYRGVPFVKEEYSISYSSKDGILTEH